MAASALRISSALVQPCSGKTLMPTLADTDSSRSPYKKGRFAACNTRSAKTFNCVTEPLGVIKIANSSPPRRPTSPPSAVILRKRWANSRNTTLPASWPKASLRGLKRSKSTNNTPKMEFEAVALKQLASKS